MMNTSLEGLKDNVRVLLWDNTHKMWKIAHLRTHNGTRFWVLDPKIFHGIDSSRFSGWVNLPEPPE